MQNLLIMSSYRASIDLHSFRIQALQTVKYSLLKNIYICLYNRRIITSISLNTIPLYNNL